MAMLSWQTGRRYRFCCSSFTPGGLLVHGARWSAWPGVWRTSPPGRRFHVRTRFCAASGGNSLGPAGPRRTPGSGARNLLAEGASSSWTRLTTKAGSAAHRTDDRAVPSQRLIAGAEGIGGVAQEPLTVLRPGRGENLEADAIDLAGGGAGDGRLPRQTGHLRHAAQGVAAADGDAVDRGIGTIGGCRTPRGDVAGHWQIERRRRAHADGAGSAMKPS